MCSVLKKTCVNWSSFSNQNKVSCWQMAMKLLIFPISNVSSKNDLWKREVLFYKNILQSCTSAHMLQSEKS